MRSVARRVRDRVKGRETDEHARFPFATSSPPMEDRLSQTLGDYWLDRARMHFEDSYMGILMTKFPEDLRVYEHLLWQDAPNVLIEIGAWNGASALWFRDRLRTLAQYRKIGTPLVISIDVEVATAAANVAALDSDYEKTIKFIASDVTDPELPQQVRAMLPKKARCMVVEDSAHVYDTTLASLRSFADFVPLGGHIIVEDGCVDIDPLRFDADWPRGVLPALDHWLTTEQGSRFAMRRDLEQYVVTCHPRGYLQRVR